jgi:hypothetical protein
MEGEISIHLLLNLVPNLAEHFQSVAPFSTHEHGCGYTDHM